MERELRLLHRFPHHGLVGQLLNSVFSLAGYCAFRGEYRLALVYFNRYLKGEKWDLGQKWKWVEVRWAKEKLGW